MTNPNDAAIGALRSAISLAPENVELAKSMYAADCIAFTELALTGYPPEDLIFRAKIKDRIEKSISKILQASMDITVIVGTPWIENDSRFNAALVMRDQKIIAKYYKKNPPKLWRV